MLRQYQKIKSQYQDCILFFRLGDFYEMFYEDAKSASKELDLVLTSRGKGTANNMPMCGIPYHAAENYIARLIKAGFKVAICEQVEDPAAAKGIVKRDVIRVVTSGTFLDEHSTDARYLACLCVEKGAKGSAPTVGLAFIDPSTGTIQTNQYNDLSRVVEFLSRMPIFECVYPQAQEETVKDIFKHPLLRIKNICLSAHEDWCFNQDISHKALCEHFQTHNLRGFGIDDLTLAVASSGALLEYLKQMNRQPLRHIDRIALYAEEDYAFVSPAAVQGLELDNVFKAVNSTETAMGKRMLRYWLYHPLKQPGPILQRQAAITLLKEDRALLQKLRDLLSRIPDIEKSVSKLSCGYLKAKDLLSIRNALALIPSLREAVDALQKKNRLFSLSDIPELRNMLEQAIDPDMPLSNNDGKVIRKGFHKELDELKDLQENGRQWLRNFQARESQRTKISSLKVGYNKVFGYYIEVTKSNLSNIPDDFIRKQTLVNAERFITPELKEHEEKILTAQDKVLKLEHHILLTLQEEILDHSTLLHEFAQSVALLDVLCSMSVLALNPGYIAPQISEDALIDIKDGRHPVVEKTINENFVPNDTYLDSDENRLIILTGPNMAGKSTYIRQIAILVILAQSGSYIPASRAHIGAVDKIFTRIGAHDDISKGQSTFMVEMTEAADILNNLTDRSLVILDEVGRGTSTYDGLSLAWALAEHLQTTKARTLFATHFHELTALAEEHSGIKNFNVAVKEWKDEVVFLHKIVPGSTDDSYGIYVAKLAGIPASVISRSKKILTQLELSANLKQRLRRPGKQGEDQLTLFAGASDPVLDEIRKVLEDLDVNTLTPIEALNQLQNLKSKLKDE